MGSQKLFDILTLKNRRISCFERGFFGDEWGWDGEEVDDKGDLINLGEYNGINEEDDNYERLISGGMDVKFFEI